MSELQKRVFTGFCFGAVLISAICFSYFSCIIAFGLVAMLCCYEWLNMLLPESYPKYLLFLAVLMGALLYFVPVFFPEGILINHSYLIYLCIFIFGIIELFVVKPKSVIHVLIIVGAWICVVFPFSFVQDFLSITKQGNSYSPYLFLIVISMVWVADMGAYFIGRKIGKHKLMPEISPKKSWEGYLGGVGLTIVFGLICSFIYPIISPIHYGMIAFIVALFATPGDLFQSMIKRQFGIKDSGNFLPGHGGFYDRFDAFIWVLPMVYFYLKFIVF